jgi:TATA-binding protein-associated factor Taf7
VKEHATLANKTCVNCKSKRTSSQWLKSKIIENADLCNNCYQKEVYQLSKFSKSGSTKTVQEIVKPLLALKSGLGGGHEEDDEEEEDDEDDEEEEEEEDDEEDDDEEEEDEEDDDDDEEEEEEE